MRSFVRSAVLTILLGSIAAAATGCSNNDTTTTTPTTPTTGFTVTETFTGTLTTNGATAFFFSVSQAGSVTITLTSTADPAGGTVPAIGVSLGTWNGTSCAVQQGIFTDNATQGAVIVGTVTGAGTLCTRVYDPATRVTNPINFSLKVDHP